MHRQMKARTIASACVLYDPSTGRIAHTHQIAVYGNTQVESKSDVEARCLKVAKQLGHEAEQMKTLRVSPADLKPGVAYKVDVETQKLIEQTAVKK